MKCIGILFVFAFLNVALICAIEQLLIPAIGFLALVGGIVFELNQ